MGQGLFEVNGFDPGMILSLKEQMARSGDILGCHNRGAAGFGGMPVVLLNTTPCTGSSMPSTINSSLAPKLSNANNEIPTWGPQN